MVPFKCCHFLGVENSSLVLAVGICPSFEETLNRRLAAHRGSHHHRGPAGPGAGLVDPGIGRLRAGQQRAKDRDVAIEGSGGYRRGAVW